ncbi:hypothetical protein CDD83_2381 [Cordyceps sp. RAO-2017]|nr:hypothetical protein CDD83_2381 [Cordyceps sp. RAO-2017]
MSIPPQLIRVKRKRVEDAPVTFLQFDGGQKRHRSGSNWAYQRRNAASPAAPGVAPQNDKPVIHVSRPAKPPAILDTLHEAPSPPGVLASRSTTSGSRDDDVDVPAPRRFHIARSAIPAGKDADVHAGAPKHHGSVPAVFVERSRREQVTKSRRLAAPRDTSQMETQMAPPSQVSEHATAETPLKRPGVANKARGQQKIGASHAPLPTSLMNRHTGDMDKIAADMNQWVLNEMRANFDSMEQEKQQQAQRVRFKPKPPAQRYRERYPEAAAVGGAQDVTMVDASDDEGDDDWVIEEYVRIPAHSVALDVAPSDIGVLVLDDDEDSLLFFGPMHDEEDDVDEDDEDENAENHYTADYPEDEVESDDEYGRHAYGYRNGTASDDEEFDAVYHSEEEGEQEDDGALFSGQGEGDEEARMARIRAYMKRNSAFP